MVQQRQWVKASSLLRIHDHTELDAPHSVGIVWTSDQLDAETSTWQHTTVRHPNPRQYSNPQTQQASRRRRTP